jgi:hypothetical protein
VSKVVEEKPIQGETAVNWQNVFARVERARLNNETVDTSTFADLSKSAGGE